MSTAQSTIFKGFSYNDIKAALSASGIKVKSERIKDHTVQKIKYIKAYVEQWLYALMQTSSNFVFLDTMCNAGIYKNGYLCTSIEVLNVFVSFAQNRPEKTFTLLCNDYNQNRRDSMSAIFHLYEDELKKRGIRNIHLRMDCMNARDYLPFIDQQYRFSHIKTIKDMALLLWVDPYHMIDEEIAWAVKKFLQNVYCEVIVNLFVSDYTRNVSNVSCPEYGVKLRSFTKGFCGLKDEKQKGEIVRNAFISQMKKGTKIKYFYSFCVKPRTGGVLYYLVFLTPSLSGLEKVKDAACKVFKYHEYYCAGEKYPPDDWIYATGETPWDVAYYKAREKVIELLKPFAGNTVGYTFLEEIFLQETFLKKSEIIDNVLKPLMKSGMIVKLGRVKTSRDFTHDSYMIVEDDE